MEIFRWYDVVEQSKDLLLLARSDSPRWDKVEKVGSVSTTFGERLTIPPDAPGPIVLQAKLKLNLLGRVVCMLYKVYPPTMHLEYHDGSVADHTLVWQNLENGFLVSSLPRDADGVRKLMQDGEAGRVRSVTFQSAQGYFEQHFLVSWYRLSAKASRSSRPVAGVESKETTIR